MFRNLNNDEVPVLIQITNINKNGLNYIKLDNLNYSLFIQEEEVLIKDNVLFCIDDISE